MADDFTDPRLDRADTIYDRYVFGDGTGDPSDADRALDDLEAELALARGRVAHLRFLRGGAAEPAELSHFEHAARLYATLDDPGGQGRAAFWVGCYHQVVARQYARAQPEFTRALELARTTGDRQTESEALRHLGIVAHAAGRLHEARARLEESSAVRRELGHDAGVAANLVGLIYVAREDGRLDDARALATEAAELATRSGAETIRRQIEEAAATLE